MTASILVFDVATSDDASASSCDATIMVEADLTAAAACYANETAGSVTTVVLNGDLTLTNTLTLNNATTAVFTIDGQGHTLTSITENDSNDVDGIAVVAGHVVLQDIVFEAKSREGVQLFANTSVQLIDATIDGTEVSTAVAAGQSGTSVSLENSSILNTTLAAIEIAGDLLMVDSTIIGPRSAIQGFANSDLVIVNSTIVDSVSNFNDRAIIVGGTASLTGVTIMDFPNGVAGAGAATLEGTLIVNSGSGACRTADGLTLTDGGGNVVGGSSCAPIAGLTPNSIVGLGLDTAAAANACGPAVTSCTPTVAITGTDSPAIDAWPGCALADDQRGVARTAGACDAGAYEGWDCPTAVGDEDDLVLGIRCYNRGGDSDRTLTFTDDVVLTEELPAIENASGAKLTLAGEGQTLTAVPAEIAFDVLDGDLEVNELTIQGPMLGGVRVWDDTPVVLTESVITGMTDFGVEGVAIGTPNTSPVTLRRTSVDGGQTGVSVGGLLQIFESTIANASGKGVITGPGGTTIENSTLANNGHGLEIFGGATTVVGTTITHNTSQGVRLLAGGTGTVTFTDSLNANNNGSCSGADLATRVVDGGGNVMSGTCGPIAFTPGLNYGLLPGLTQNACAAGVACTQTVAIPAGFPAAGAGQSCNLATDQRGELRPPARCDAGSFELSNQAPAGVADDFGTSMHEDDPATALDVLDNDTDPEADPLAVSAVSNLTSGAGAVVVDGDGLGVTYTPAADFNGAVSFDYTVVDSNGATGSATASVFVTPVNDAPVAVDDTLSAVKGSNGENGTDVTLRVIDNDFDVDDAVFTIDTVTQPVPAAAGQVFVSASPRDSVIFRPSPTFVGESTFTYTLVDNFGVANSTSEPATVTVTTAGSNDDPIAVDDTFPGFVIVEDAGPTVLDVLANDSDPNGDDIEVASVDEPATGGTTSVINGEIIFTPFENFNGGIPVFGYTISDGNGGTASARLSISVTAVNDPPVAVDDQVTLDEGTFARIQPWRNDIDAEGQSLRVTGVTQPASGTGTTSVESASFVEYVPPAEFVGTTSFTYTIEDPGGESATATVFVEVQGVNDPPVTAPDGEIVLRNSVDNVVDVLANDEDDNNDAFTVVAVTQPANGSATIGPAGLDVRYTPNAGYLNTPQAPDTFTYTIRDENGAEATGNVSIFVVTDNNSPVATDDRFELVEPGATDLLVLANDSDADADELMVVSATQPFPVAAGFIRLADDRKSIEFVPQTAFSGEATFSYVVSDGENGDSAFVTVTASASLACDPNYLPCIAVSSSDLNCSDLDVAVQVVGEDIHGLDADGDGRGCTSNGESPPLLCNGLPVTIDMNQAGVSGVGTEGADVILGTPGNDVIDARAGDDVVCAGGGDDRVQGNTGTDTIFGGPGNDKLFGASGFDEIHGGPGDDTIHGNRGNDRLFGDEGADKIFGYAHDDVIVGGPGNDRLHGNFGFDVIDGGEGDDAVFGYGDEDTLNGGPGNDIVSGNRGDDLVNGDEGDDEVWGADGNDEVNGGPGDDIVNGNSLNDVLTGGPGNDVLDGGIDADTCDGGSGTDTATRCENITGVP